MILTPPDPHYMLFEDWLAQEVHHRLVLFAVYSVFDNLEYKINGNEVTLLGQVCTTNCEDRCRKCS